MSHSISREEKNQGIDRGIERCVVVVECQSINRSTRTRASSAMHIIVQNGIIITLLKCSDNARKYDEDDDDDLPTHFTVPFRATVP